ncbi:MAG: NAD-dependent epimerase/dehydratase family protein [Burkholderiales bacterium]|nr:NAD-dependent epimerase/dehydratase family protein [Burkholderiales bacterium]
MKRLLIAGCGDVARRALPALESRFECRCGSRARGFDLDRPETLGGIEADAVLHCAPPPATGDADTRTANLLAALEKASILPARIVYVSTSGVYGDCGGALVAEDRPVDPQTPRARRRADAERRLGEWCAARGVALAILRAPGIYAADRLPLERLRRGIPVLRPEDDVYTNHIHADDLAAIAVRALEEDAPAGIYNAADDTRLKMGDWLDLVADATGLARPPRIARAEAAGRIPPEMLSFMGESRLLDNTRLKTVLGVRLAYPTVYEGLRNVRAARTHEPA